MNAAPETIKVLPEPMLEFGYKQQLEDPRNGLFLFGPIVDRKPSQIRAGVVGTPKGVSIFRTWLENANRLIPAGSDQSIHQFAVPSFEAAFRTPWPSIPAVEIAVSSTDVANSI